MFVSKKKYDEQYALWEAAWHDLYGKLAQAEFDLATLKASRARSNENLKLGTAASAKARRKGAVIDWSGNLEAYHEDGRIIPVARSDANGAWPDADGDYHTTGIFDGWNGIWTSGGEPWNNYQEGWRIRNV